MAFLKRTDTMKRNRFLLSRLSISVAVLVALGLLPVGGSAQTSSQTPPSTVRVPQTTQPRPRTPVQTPVQQLPDWKTPHRIPVFTDVAIEVTSSGRRPSQDR